MNDAPILVHDRVDDRMSGAAVLRLHMEDLSADADIGIEAGAHKAEPSRYGNGLRWSGENLDGWEFI